MDAGIIVENQAVPLGGIDDDAESLGTLLKNLTRYDVIPHYIFQYHPISGIKSQFQIPLTEGCRIVKGAKNMQSDQGKCIHCAVSHVTGKIEIPGQIPDRNMLFKHHQTKYKKDQDRIFCEKLAPGQAWLQGRQRTLP